MAKFISYSGAAAGRPNAHMLRWGERRVLFDCGQGQEGAVYLEEMERPDMVWISHAHGDHCGALLKVLERWPGVKVVATTKTARLLRFALDGEPSARVEAAVKRVVKVGLRRFREIPGVSGMRIMALEAGHVPGSAMAVVEFQEEGRRRRVLYTGDYCAHDQVVVGGAGVPDTSGEFRIDAVISEAVLATDQAAEELEYAEEVRLLTQAIGEGDGPLLVGVSGVGESVEAAALLVMTGRSVMVDEYLRPVIEVSRGELGDRFSALQFGNRRRLAGHLRADGAVVAPGDQFQRKSSAALLAGSLIEDPSATLVVLNRARRKTGAGRLLAAKKGEEVDWYGRRATLKANVLYGRLINHGPRWQLMGFLQGVGAASNFLVHGTDGARWALKRALDKQGFEGEVKVVEVGEEYEF